jgi:hypothetical protein
MVKVNYNDLFIAADFVSGGGGGASAYVCTETGAIHLVSSYIGEEVPDDLETSDKYFAVPSKRELDLGFRLVLSFAADEMPDAYDEIGGIFRKKGAYGRFKDFLARKGALEKWYAYEEDATRAALRDWCEENGLELDLPPPPSKTG